MTSAPLALVTGSAVRVGRAIARSLGEAGFDLVLHANASRAAVSSLAAELRSLGRQATVEIADLALPREVDALAARIRALSRPLDLLVHNAALFEKVAFPEIDRDRYRRMQAVNVEAPFFLTQGLLPALLAAPAPLVVHVADIAGERPIPGFSHYAVSKAALLMLARSLAVELAPQVRVNAISPGTVAFPEGLEEATRARLRRLVPLGREGRPEDVARAVLYLVDADYVTGQVLTVDGGRSCRL